MSFQDILGNERVKKTLRKALQKKKVPNSYLFSGPEGVGKREMALVLAKAMNCQRKKDDACGICPPCKAINAGNFPDVMEIQLEGNVIKIERIRELRRIAYLKPMAGGRRMFIINEAEKMTEEAANSLLKILEEPPLFTYIILLTHNPFLIMPTIKSRCQILSFTPVSREEIKNLLIENGYKQEKASIISLYVRGNTRLALSLEWEEIQTRRKQGWELFSSLLKRENFAYFLRNYASYYRNIIREEWIEILEILSSFCRDAILLKEKGDLNLLMNPDYEGEIRNIEPSISCKWLMDCLRKIDEAIYGFQKNLNVNLLVSSFFANFKEWEYA